MVVDNRKACSALVSGYRGRSTSRKSANTARPISDERRHGTARASAATGDRAAASTAATAAATAAGERWSPGRYDMSA